MVKKIFKRLFRLSKALVTGPFWYGSDLFRYRLMQKITGDFFLFPQIFDKDPASHSFDKHYVYMDRWAFKHLLLAKPSEHVDIGSSIRFLSMASTVSKLTFVDIRPVNLDFDNFTCVPGSILKLPFADESINSLSCLHVAEHIGLGRYGDPLDPEGTIKACRELSRILAPGGRLYFALPIGRTATYFNAHRVHNPEIILNYFSGLRLLEFAIVTDTGRFINPADPKDYNNSTYACGMYLFTK